MSQDHDNPTSAAAAPAPEASVNSTTETTKPTPLEAALSMEAAPTEEPAQSAVDSETPHPDAEAAPAAEEAPGAEEMSQLMEEYGEPHEAPAQSEILEGKVVGYTEQGVVVDLGLKSEGPVPAAEFTETDIPRPEPGSTIEVQRSGEEKDGYILLAYQRVLRRRMWEKIDAAYKAKETLTGKIVDRIKGGLVVDIGVRAFLPGSQYDLRPAQNLDDLTGTEMQVRITKRSEEHTSELQSLAYLVCRLLL